MSDTEPQPYSEAELEGWRTEIAKLPRSRQEHDPVWQDFTRWLATYDVERGKRGKVERLEAENQRLMAKLANLTAVLRQLDGLTPKPRPCWKRTRRRRRR